MGKDGVSVEKDAREQLERVRAAAVQRVTFFFSSRRRHTRFDCDWSSDVCSSDLVVNNRGNSLSIVDEAARAVVGVRRIPRNVSSATLDPEAGLLYLALKSADRVEIGRASCRERV